MTAFAAPTIAELDGVFTVDLRPGLPVVHRQVVSFRATPVETPVPIGSLMQRVLAIYGLPDQAVAAAEESTEADELCCSSNPCYSSRR